MPDMSELSSKKLEEMYKKLDEWKKYFRKELDHDDEG
jgi:hypothetical protein